MGLEAVGASLECANPEPLAIGPVVVPDPSPDAERGNHDSERRDRDPHASSILVERAFSRPRRLSGRRVFPPDPPPAYRNNTGDQTTGKADRRQIQESFRHDAANDQQQVGSRQNRQEEESAEETGRRVPSIQSYNQR